MPAILADPLRAVDARVLPVLGTMGADFPIAGPAALRLWLLAGTAVAQGPGGVRTELRAGVEAGLLLELRLTRGAPCPAVATAPPAQAPAHLFVRLSSLLLLQLHVTGCGVLEGWAVSDASGIPTDAPDVIADLADADPDLPGAEDVENVDLDGPDLVETDGGGEPEADARTGPPRVRSCGTEFAYHPVAAVAGVKLVGEWDGFSAQVPMEPDGAGGYRAELDLEPGLWCYRYVVTSEASNDPEARYLAYCGGELHSAVRVPECTGPRLTVDEVPPVDPDGLKVRVLFWADPDESPPAKPQLSLVRDFEETPVDAAWDEEWATELSLSPEQKGKYTLRVESADEAGRPAKPLLLPFWVEEKPFDWRGALVYATLVDRGPDGDGEVPASPEGTEAAASWMGGDLVGLRGLVEDGYLPGLSVDALWISPVNENPDTSHEEDGHQVGSYHGYWPVAPDAVDPRFGGKQALKDLVSAAHREGIRVVLELVADHVHTGHPWIEEGFFTEQCLCESGTCPDGACWLADYLPDIDWEVRQAADMVVENALHWIEELDLDGVRVAAVDAAGLVCARNLVSRVEETFEQGGTDYHVAGAVHPPGAKTAPKKAYQELRDYLVQGGLDGVTEAVLRDAVTGSELFTEKPPLADPYAELAYWTERSDAELPRRDKVMTYLGDHDTGRFLSLVADGSVAETKWMEAEAPTADEVGAYARAGIGLCWLLTTRGMPVLFMGDEYGEHGYGEPDNRKVFRGHGDLLYEEGELRETVRALASVRRDTSALRTGAYHELAAADWRLVYLRLTDAGEPALVAINGGEGEATVSVPAGPLCASIGCPVELKKEWTRRYGDVRAAAELVGTSFVILLPPASCNVFVP